MGSIPARAGETAMALALTPFIQVYPRTGGGNGRRGRRRPAVEGLSPHGRGKLTVDIPKSPIYRSIPARAGETVAFIRGHFPQRVYPRTGGGNKRARICGGNS